MKTMGLDGLDIWYELYKETAARNHLFLNDIKYFEAVLRAKPILAVRRRCTFVDSRMGRHAVGGHVLVMTANRGSYLYGASSSQHRNLMPTYALQWEAIQLSKANGCTEYDMFGISPSPDPSHLYTGFIGLNWGLVAKSTIAWGVGIIRWMKKSMHFSGYRKSTVRVII